MNTTNLMSKLLAILGISLVSAGFATESHDHAHSEPTPKRSVDLFMTGALAKPIETIACTLADGTKTSCYKIIVAGFPVGAKIGPFCPKDTSASAQDSGIWLDGKNLYDATGQFILDLPTIYSDSHWKLHNDDGTVRVTDTKEAFEAAARPDVDEKYQNYCVEGRMEWLADGKPVTTTVLIPVNPIRATNPTPAIQAPLGVTFSGIRIDAPAPVHAILSAYTIAAFDDCGGHVNPFEGYHMHAATGCGEVGDAPAEDTAPFGLSMDGYTIHSPLLASDLDSCNGHTTQQYGYHYHAQAPELNGVLTCYMGQTVQGSNSPQPTVGHPKRPPPNRPAPHEHRQPGIE